MNKSAAHPSESGAAAIEFAASTAVLFTLLFGSIGVSMAFYTYEVINQYARDASRYAIVHGAGCEEAAHGNASCNIGGASANSNQLKTYLNNEIYPGIKGNSLTVATSYTHAPGAASCSVAPCNGAGDQVTVTVSYPYLYAIPFVPQRSFTMNAQSTMIISQ